MDKLTVQVICGFGVGTSTLLKIKIQNILGGLGVESNVFTGNISSVGTASLAMPEVIPKVADVIFTSKELADNIRDCSRAPVVAIDNFTDSTEIKEKLEEFLRAQR